MLDKRFKQQIEFIIEIDKLKTIVRQTCLIDRTRKENDAEHSWHLAMMALLLEEYGNEQDIDVLHVIKMVLIHDLVEIDAGDTFAYDKQGNLDKKEREERAAKRLFNILPQDQRNEIYSLWHEFEERKTPESQFAVTIDRLQPLLHNYYTEGEAWQEHGVTSKEVLNRIDQIKLGSDVLGEYASELVHDAVRKGYLLP